jgi:hypothetical protein
MFTACLLLHDEHGLELHFSVNHFSVIAFAFKVFYKTIETGMPCFKT